MTMELIEVVTVVSAILSCVGFLISRVEATYNKLEKLRVELTSCLTEERKRIDNLEVKVTRLETMLEEVTSSSVSGYRRRSMESGNFELADLLDRMETDELSPEDIKRLKAFLDKEADKDTKDGSNVSANIVRNKLERYIKDKINKDSTA